MSKGFFLFFGGREVEWGLARKHQRVPSAKSPLTLKYNLLSLSLLLVLLLLLSSLSRPFPHFILFDCCD